MYIYALLMSYVMGSDYERGLNQRIYEDLLIVWPDSLGVVPFAPYTATFMRYTRALYNVVTKVGFMTRFSPRPRLALTLALASL